MTDDTTVVGFRVRWVHEGGTGNAFCTTRREADALAARCNYEGARAVVIEPVGSSDA